MEIRTTNEYTEKRILELADNMAAAAASFNAHGYDAFINAREELQTALKTVMNDSGSVRKSLR